MWVTFLSAGTWKGENKGKLSSLVKVKVDQSCPTLFDPVGTLSLSQGIIPTKGSNPGLPHCGQILSAEPQGKPKNIGVVAYPFSRGLSQPRNWIRVSCIAGRFFCQLSYQGSPLISGKACSSKICTSDYVKRSEQKNILKAATECQRITMIIFFTIWYTKAL